MSYPAVLTFLFLAGASTPQLHDVDEIELSRYHVRCTPSVFQVSLAASEGTRNDTLSFGIDEQATASCDAGGFAVTLEGEPFVGGGGFCAGAPNVNIAVNIGNRPIYRGRLAEYCAATGITSLAIENGRVTACGFGALPGSAGNERVAGCVDYGDVAALVGGERVILSDPFIVVSSRTPPEVDAYLERRDLCVHWLGEDGYDEEREAEIVRSIERHCTGLDAARDRLLKKYAAEPASVHSIGEVGPLGY